MEVRRSHSMHDGHKDTIWKRGAGMTGPDEGLWVPGGSVTAEHVRHMVSRVEEFTATYQFPEGSMRDVPECGESWSLFVLRDSVRWANRFPPGSWPPAQPDEEDEE